MTPFCQTMWLLLSSLSMDFDTLGHLLILDCFPQFVSFAVHINNWVSSFFVSVLLNCFLFLPLQFSSVAQLCPTLCDPMNHSTPGLPVHHQLLEFTQTHVHWVSDAIQPSHPLLSPSLPAFNLSQHRGLFKWVSSSHQVAKVLEF